MVELCEINQGLLKDMPESDHKEFITHFAKANRVGLKLGLNVAIFEIK